MARLTHLSKNSSATRRPVHNPVFDMRCRSLSPLYSRNRSYPLLKMTLEEIADIVPGNWLTQHQEEYIEITAKITKTIMFSEAINRQWPKPMKTREDFDVFFEAEAKEKGKTAKEIEFFMIQAGKFKAQIYIFDKYFVPLFPKNEAGKCKAAKSEVLNFIQYSLNKDK